MNNQIIDNFYISSDNTIQCRSCYREITPDEVNEDGVCDICIFSAESELSLAIYEGGGR